MTRRNKFGILPDAASASAADTRKRRPGPMGTAIRDVAENLQASTDEKIEQRKRNAADAKEYRAALVEGRLLLTLSVDEVATDDLPRDRLELETVASSDEMAELKASIQARGQREPIEVFRDVDGVFQLKSGWRRLNALRQLHDETGNAAFSRIKARIAEGGDDRLSLYIDMAEENVIREDLTFAEMAQLAITAASDPAFESDDPDTMVGEIYRSVHKVKRSYIRSFVTLLEELGESLQWPKNVPRNLGVDVARLLKAEPALGEGLRKALEMAHDTDDQARLLIQFVSRTKLDKSPKKRRKPKEKYEFHHKDAKITARHGECRIVSPVDYTQVPRERLEKAIEAFQKALES